jgi:hypothetical protein
VLKHRELTVALAARHRLPAVYAYRIHVMSGGLISYGLDNLDQYRRARVLNVLVPEVSLQRACVVAGIGERIAARVPERLANDRMGSSAEKLRTRKCCPPHPPKADVRSARLNEVSS